MRRISIHGGMNTDNLDILTTACSNPGEPDVVYEVNLPFALWLVENALENALPDADQDLPTETKRALAHLRKVLGGEMEI